MTSKTTNKFSPEVRTRARRLVLDHERSHDLLARRRIRIDCLLSGVAAIGLPLTFQALLPKTTDAIDRSLLSGVIFRNCSGRVVLLRHSCFESLLSALARCLDCLSTQMCVRHAQ